MITYLLESLTIQLVFLLAYDLFLKKETFLQLNRIYLLTTFIFSLLLPWIKIEVFKTTAPEKLVEYQQFFWQLDEVVLSTSASQNGFWEDINWTLFVLVTGNFCMIAWLIVKLKRIYKLKRSGVVSRERDFIKVIIPKSKQAFSFFKNVFLGGSILQEKHENILAHEMVHVKQWHSLDLMFFEVMRIAFWFNPLVYLYQNRISELHEFIADAQASKSDKKVQYELLLSEVFQSQNFSLVNQFFKQSLIKKRIFMLTKEKSKTIYQFKYALILPLVLGMLMYTSCDQEQNSRGNDLEMNVENTSNLSDKQQNELFNRLKELSDSGTDWEFKLKDKDSYILYKKATNDSYVKFDGIEEAINATMAVVTNVSSEESLSGQIAALQEEIEAKDGLSSNELEAFSLLADTFTQKLNQTKKTTDGWTAVIGVDGSQNVSGSFPFAVVEEVPIYPGCEDAEDKKACFMEKLTEHIRKNFKYPEEAREQGIQGKVNVIFRINSEGYIIGIRKRGPHKLLENEAARIINKLPKMTPGKQQGKPVNVPFSIPISFKL